MTALSVAGTGRARRALPAWLLGLGIGVYLLAFLNHSLWQQWVDSFASLGGPWSQWRLSLTTLIRLVGVEAIIIAAVLWPRLGKPLLIALLLVSAASAYFMDHYGAWLNQEVVQSIFETSPAEARALLTGDALRWFALYGVLPAVLVACLPLRFAPWRRSLRWRGALVLGLLGLMGASAWLGGRDFVYYNRNHRGIYDVYNPYAALSGSFHYLQRDVLRPHRALKPWGEDARLAPLAPGQRRLLVLVVGETARAEDWSLQGYARNTNPQLAARGVYYFRDTWSCGTATTVSVPCMFSGMGREQFDKAQAQARWNLLDILQHAGVAVSWRDNDEGCKGVCLRVPNEDLTNRKDPDLCTADGCLDEILVRDLPQRLAALPAGASLLVLHLKGSHGPAYFQRYPAAAGRFAPACDTAELQTCSYAQVVASYDNTIAYTDQILGQVVDALKALPGGTEAAMLYLSDHGESLGEGGIYLHGADWATAPSQQKHIPMALWLSSNWQAQFDGASCLHEQEGRHWSQDNLFHTVLGLYGVSSQVYQRPLDMLASCRAG